MNTKVFAPNPISFIANSKIKKDENSMKIGSKFLHSRGVLLILSIGFILFTVTNCRRQTDSKQEVNLVEGFKNPPKKSRPRVWWHWMNGNITKKGIREDLDWMHSVGIAGFQTFNAALMTPNVVKHRLAYMTPGWKDAFRFATRLADSLNMEMGIAGSPGWSESGGPWVKPSQGMKKYTWSKIRIKGGQLFNGKLPQPPATTGPFQNIPFQGRRSSNANPNEKKPEYYKDVAVVAFKLPDVDKTLRSLNPKVTSSGGKFSLTSLTNGSFADTTLLPSAEVGKKAWIQYEFSQPQTFQSLTIGTIGGGRRFGRSAGSNWAIEVSNDGASFRTVQEIPEGGVGQRTISFEPVTAKYVRFSIKTSPPPPANELARMFGNSSSPKGTEVSEFNLHTGVRVNRFADKAAFTTASNIYSMNTRAIPASDAVKKSDVIDLTSKMKEDGTLSWTPPPGNWMVLRMGYSLLGITNHPASAEATGLEVDKMSAADVKAYFTHYLDMYESATGGMMGKKGIQYIVTDSWEAGAENWTEKMMEDFKNRRGYSMVPWLPVLAGYVVQSSEASDRFLWDFRQTIADLITENHYNQLTKMLHERGMGRYSESHESGRALIADGMAVKEKADIPMSAMWTPGGFFGGSQIRVDNKADVRESASVAHIYGQNIVAAESMTSAGNLWAWSPQTLKFTADMELASGLNRFVIHESAHQPVDDKVPGFTLGPFGQTFNRHETWAKEAGPWITYLARSSYMLQQGKFVADIAYYYGQDSNITSLFENKLPTIPEGYNYDFVNADALINQLSVSKGNIVTPTGMSYKVLALDPNSRYMTLPVLHKIQKLVNDGAIIVGNKPIGTPSLSDDEQEFKALAGKLWSNENGVNNIGKGKIYAGYSIGKALTSLNIMPDFQYTKPKDDSKLLYVHRRLGDKDIYWVDSRNDSVQNVEATFRVSGKEAELWNPVTGNIKEASYSINGGSTKVPLHLEPHGAVFVVFQNQAKENSRTVPDPMEQQLTTIDGPWDVHFQADRGAPAEASFKTLQAWNKSSNKGIKYFSGTGTYTKTINAKASWFDQGGQIWIDLGTVKDLAQVIVNGQPMGIVWKEPFHLNITGALKQGSNTIKIKVTNLWVNRLIGDQQPNVSKTYTWTSFPVNRFYPADTPLKPSGLLGPVRVIKVKKEI